ncbi:MAG: 1-(5-phosphoribosyl)-5-[(5-phosphoribosylamino)methylideneamino] imidazole-4-carboxamide isomerase [Candidatus Altiarchaeota archaeon]
MEVIPAIDIMGGRCVQLVGGKPDTKKDFGDPVSKALEWKRGGARMLHIVDLDATLEGGNNFGLALKVKRAAGLPVEFGGGIRSLDSARNALDALKPEDRIVVGTLAAGEYPEFKTLKALAEYMDRIIVAVDSKGGYVTVKGWTEDSRLKTEDMMRACGKYVWGFLYTNVDVEGRMEGIDYGAAKAVVDASDKPVIISGGISSKADVESCRKAGAWGVVLGKALYEGKLRPDEVF